MSFISDVTSKYVVIADDNIRLYRGLEQKFDSNYDTSKSDAPHGYSTWTDSLELAKQYAGESGHIYYLDLPKSEMGKSAIDENPKSETYGDRVLFFFNGKPAGLNGVTGKEVLVYTLHDLYDPNMVKEMKEITSKIQHHYILAYTDDEIFSLAKQYEGSVYADSADNYKWKYFEKFPVKELLKRDAERNDKRSRWDQDDWIEWGKKNNKTNDKASLLHALKTPIVLVDDGYDIYIWDGHHRIAGCLINNLNTIPAIVGKRFWRN
jgi:hypothetical protein